MISARGGNPAFFRNDSLTLKEKPGFLRGSQKKMYKKLLIGYLYLKIYVRSLRELGINNIPDTKT
ncbi:Uncharacterized protein dnm_046310 [Desulfonema magnum]|uniref:Uncharacterized protein n=1 Tax=Desulfonema magnum TaxID=45655 RepID=A0A975BP46_9BACT|nr:Uncharacterized protein dnm_046310 [Desulfonema magnum]